MVWARVVALIVAGLFVVGCDGENPSPKPSATIPAAKPIPEAGQCLAKEVPDLDDFAPDLDSRVDCTTPHIYEVTAVVDAPTWLLKAKTPQELVVLRDKLATVDNEDEQKQRYDAFAGQACSLATTRSAGLSKLELRGKSITEASVEVVLSQAQVWLNLLDAGNWAKGNTKILCTIRYDKGRSGGSDVEGLPDPRSIRSQSREPAVQSFLTKDFPLTDRLCVTLKDRGSAQPLSCETPHQGEIIFAFDALPVLGKKFVESIGLDEPSKQEAKVLNRPCLDALPIFLGADHDADLTAVAQIGQGGWLGRGDYYPTLCVVVARDSGFDLPGGSRIGRGAEPVDLVPVGQSQVSWLRSR